MSKARNLDAHLKEVSAQFVSIKDAEYRSSQQVFKSVFDEIKRNMERHCNYFRRYASQVTYGGSVSDGIKVGRLDEFDMDIVIRLPVSYQDGPGGIGLEPDRPGYLRLVVPGFDHLDKQTDWESYHKVTRDWRDRDGYLLQNRFRFWLNSLVQRALNTMGGRATVDGKEYQLRYKASGPAYTLQIRAPGPPAFELDIDLVPVIRFMLPRWPPGYRMPENHKCKEWYVVPKPNKAEQDLAVQNRCWRLSFQDFEREMIKDCKHLKLTIRLVKKLRDALGMKAIASYYIKTLFLWKIHETNNKSYWETKLSVLFREMVQKLHDAVKSRNIPYYWHAENNLIDGLKPTLQAVYLEKLSCVLRSIDDNNPEKTALFLLTPQEASQFKTSPFYCYGIDATDSKVKPPPPQPVRNRNSGSPKPLKENVAPDSAPPKRLKENVMWVRNDISGLMQQLRITTDWAESLSAEVEEQQQRISELERENQALQAQVAKAASCSVQ